MKRRRQLHTSNRAPVISEMLEPRRLMAVSAGIPDPTFAGNPYAVPSSADGNFSLNNIESTAIAPNGDIVLAGPGDQGIVVARLLPNGQLDTSFGDGGYATAQIDLSSGAIEGLVVAADGTIVVAGTNDELAQGELLGFSADGMTTTTDFTGGDFFPGDDYSSAVLGITLESDGDVVAVGYGQSSQSDGSGSLTTFGLTSYNVDSLDQTDFGNTSLAQMTGELSVVAPGLNGQIIVAGQTLAGADYLARLNSDGSIDASFKPALKTAGTPLGNNEYVTALATRSSGGVDLVTYAYSNSDFTTHITQLTSTGALDTSFNNTGIQTLDNVSPDALAVQSDGKVILGAESVTGAVGSKVEVVRLTSAGALDSSFGSSGVTIDPLPTGYTDSQFGGMSIDGDGRIVTAAQVESNNVDPGAVPSVYRLLPGEYAYNGAPAAFASTGATTIQAYSYDNGGEGVAYHDTDVVNDAATGQADEFSALRPGSGVDLELIGTGSTVPHVAYVRAGEYVQYTITAPVTGVYPVSASVANLVTGGTFHLSVDGTSTGTEVAIPDTGSSMTFQSISAGSVNLLAGTHVIRVTFDAVGKYGYAGNVQSFTFTTPATTSNGTKLTGTTIGTPGSYNNDGNTIVKATDGNLSTFFDNSSANGNWVGLDLGTSGGVVTQIEYASRSGLAARMNGGIFQASDSATFASGVVNLYTIASNANPSSTALTSQTISNTTAYRYYRYLSPNGSYGDVSEVQFYGKAGGLVTTGATKLTGTTIGTSGSYKNDGNTIAKATDGSLSTFFDNSSANGNWVGLDLGTSGGVATQIEYASRSGLASRMNGGIFQASDSATFASGVANLYTIASNANPSSTALTTQTISNTTAYRYYRYLSPNGSYGDVSEVQFYGKAGGLNSTPAKLTGTTIGTSGSYNNDGNTIAKATDGNLSTFFDNSSANGNWVGLDLGSSKSISEISYAPRSGEAARMVGGEFQISTSASFSSGVTTIATITASPVVGSLTTITLSSPVTARYVRYLSPNGSYGDISEFQLLG